jgi:hypothetical protein
VQDTRLSLYAAMSAPAASSRSARQLCGLSRGSLAATAIAVVRPVCAATPGANAHRGIGPSTIANVSASAVSDRDRTA